MPHVVYLPASVLCPWSGCGYRIEFLDFQLERMADPAFYKSVLMEWGRRPGFGVVGRCPGCKQYVLFGLTDKQPIQDPTQTAYPVLPDDWYLNAYIA